MGTCHLCQGRTEGARLICDPCYTTRSRAEVNEAILKAVFDNDPQDDLPGGGTIWITEAWNSPTAVREQLRVKALLMEFYRDALRRVVENEGSCVGGRDELVPRKETCFELYDDPARWCGYCVAKMALKAPDAKESDKASP